jgi:hypothetical protein
MIKYFILEKLYAENDEGPDDCNAQHTPDTAEHVKTVKQEEYEYVGKDGNAHDLGDVIGFDHPADKVIKGQPLPGQEEEDEKGQHRNNNAGDDTCNKVIVPLSERHVRILF